MRSDFTTPAIPQHHGKIAGSLKSQLCGKCGRMIMTHERFITFPWHPGRPDAHRVVCLTCAMAPDDGAAGVDLAEIEVA